MGTSDVDYWTPLHYTVIDVSVNTCPNSSRNILQVVISYTYEQSHLSRHPPLPFFSLYSGILSAISYIDHPKALFYGLINVDRNYMVSLYLERLQSEILFYLFTIKLIK